MGKNRIRAKRAGRIAADAAAGSGFFYPALRFAGSCRPFRAILFFLFPIFSWADPAGLLQKMTLEEKVGQLFIAPASSRAGEDHFADWERLISECHIGGAICMVSTLPKQTAFLERLQKISKIPLLVAADLEWGLGMRMTDAISFPRNLTLGAVQNLFLLEEMGRSIGRQALAAGIHLNLAPVADVNCNPKNPIIHMRSFGEDPSRVAACSCALIRGMHEAGLLACAKHFPGHGDTATDSHYSLPVLSQEMSRLENVELVPFRAAIDAEVDCVMSGHLLAEAIDKNAPASLSAPCLTDLLRGQLHFQGLIVSDALNMGALARSFSPEEIAIMAYAAGNDLLLYMPVLESDLDQLMKEIPRAYQALLAAFREGRFSIEDLDSKVLRILKMKEQPKNADNLSVPETHALKRTLFREALTQIGEFHLDDFVYVAIGAAEGDWFVEKMRQRGRVVCLNGEETKIPSFDQPVVVGLHRVNGLNFGLSPEMKQFIKNSSLALLFCTPYAIDLVAGPCLIAYENDPDAEEAVWDALSGRLTPHGHLPLAR